jgi:RHS repeat-associated protein
VVAITSMTGSVVERYTYTAYGTAEIRHPLSYALRTSSIKDWTVLYTGRDLDLETGLYYYRARYYDSQLGRFIGRDPAGYDSGMNLYEYVGDDPLTRGDPSGLATIDPGGKTCTPGQKDLIFRVISEIRTEVSIAASGGKNCFTKRDWRGCAGDKCRANLNECLRNTIDSSIKILCSPNPVSNTNGSAGGQCVASKNNPLPRHPNPNTRPRDPGNLNSDTSCNACPWDYLSHSTITLWVGMFNNLSLFAHTLLHELLHNCVGGHLRPYGDPDLQRPDADYLAGDYLRNCGKPVPPRRPR